MVDTTDSATKQQLYTRWCVVNMQWGLYGLVLMPHARGLVWRGHQQAPWSLPLPQQSRYNSAA
jgi:hypothetical protein